MSDAVTIALVGSMTTVVVSTINLVLAFLSSARGKRNEEHLVALKEQTNGISERLVKVTGEAEFAKGLKQGEDNPK